jgi:hypothetical protein
VIVLLRTRVARLLHAASIVAAFLAASGRGEAAAAAEFRRLNGEQIGARIIGRDITDDFHWSEHYRRNGVLVIEDLGRQRRGRWKIERDRLCLMRGAERGFECLQVWVSGDEVSLRAHEIEQPPTAYIRRHQGS